MKEKNVYKRDYKEKELGNYNTLIKKIKADNYDELPSNNPFEQKYLGYDDGFITITSVKGLNPNGYGSSNKSAEIIIEKIGPDVKNLSEIEKILIKNSFKKET